MRCHGRLLRAVTAAAPILAVLAVLGAAPPGAGDDAAPSERNEIMFAKRWTGDLRGGLLRIGNSAVTCDEQRDQYRIEEAEACVRARKAEGRNIYNNDYQMVQRPRTSAKLALPARSRVVHARLYWGGTNGMDSPNGPRTLGDDRIGKVTLTPPGKPATTVTADTALGRWRGEVEYAYQASADVTALVAAAGAGDYTLSDLGVVATPYSFGAWTLVVAYANDAEPRRRLTLYDGYRAVESGVTPVRITLDGLKDPRTDWPRGRIGYVAYDGDRTLTGDEAWVRAPHGMPITLLDAANPELDTMNSTADGFSRNPADRNTFGWDADEFDVTGALWPGDSALGVTFATTDDGDGYQVGVVYSQVDL